MRILFTGFGPFGDVEDNPSGRLASHFGARGLEGHDIRAEVLPVSFERAGDAIRRLVLSAEYDLVLMTGVAVRSEAFRLERFAANEDSARIPDCDGMSPQAAAIVPDASATLESTVDLIALCSDLNQNWPDVALSEDAGRYVCNHVYYCALHEIVSSGRSTAALFLHVPSDPQTFDQPGSGQGVPYERQVSFVNYLLQRLAG